MRQALEIPVPTAEEVETLETLYRTTREVRLRTRAQIVLLAGEQRLTAPAIARIVRENDETVRRWLRRWVAEGITGMQDRPMPGGPSKITDAYRQRLLAVVRQRPPRRCCACRIVSSLTCSAVIPSAQATSGASSSV